MRISGFAREDGIVKIEDFILKKSCNNHSFCSFRAYILSKYEDKFLAMVDKPLKVTLDKHSESGDKDGNVIFYGVIDDVVLHNSYWQTAIEIRAVSYSLLEDEKIQWRIFQNPEKKLQEVTDAIKLQKYKVKFTKDGEEKAKSVSSHVILQNQETDFGFLKRLASANDLNLWVSDTEQRDLSLFLGKTVDGKTVKLKYESIYRYKRRSARYGKGLIIATREYCPLGAKLEIGSQVRPSYVVKALELVKENGIDIFTYELEEQEVGKNKDSKNSLNKLEKNTKLEAEVTDVKDPQNKGRIRVHFLEQGIEDKCPKDKQIWIEYRSPYCGKVGGIVFLPDVGDKVEVIFNNEECYVNSTLRINELNEECKNVIEKYIGNNYEQRIFWKEKSLEFFSFENSLVMNKEMIRLKVGENTITMTKDAIELKTKDSILVLDSSNISANVQKNIEMHAANQVLIKADKDLEESAIDVKLKATGNFKIDASSDFTAQAGKDGKIIAGGTAKLNGSTVDVKSSGSVNINGSSINLT